MELSVDYPNNYLKIKNTVEKYVSGTYNLPVIDDKKVFYIIPLSGGLDSFATAYTLLAKFPTTPFTFVHADTMAEAEGTEEALKAFEDITGRRIIKLKPKAGLFEGIEKYGNFIPSQRHRSCTQTLKTAPIKKFFDALKQRHGDDSLFMQFVGLRADEPKRKGIEWSQEHIGSAYPLQSLGIKKQDVNKIVEEIQITPIYYLNKSRSGCVPCIFSRRSELVDAWSTSSARLDRAAKMEEVPENILKIYNDLPTPVTKLLNAGRNWLNFYRPAALGYPRMGCEEKRGKNKINNKIIDLFGASQSKRIYVAIEYHYYPNNYGIAKEPFIFFESLLTYSTSLGGIKKSLKHFWLHRLHTKEMYNHDEKQIGEERRIFIFEIEVDDYDNEIPKSPDEVFTWQNDRTPLYAIRKTVSVIERILLTEGERQNTRHSDLKIKEQALTSMEKLDKQKEYGRTLNVSEYIKPSFEELVDDIDITEAPTACMACSR